MKTILAMTLLILSTSSSAATEKPECEAFLARDAFVRLAEGALKKAVITAADLRRVADSPRPVNPMLGKPASVESVSFQKSFATVIGRMTPEFWPEVQTALHALGKRSAAEAEIKEESREMTRTVLAPKEIYKKKVSSTIRLVDLSPESSDVTFHLWDQSRPEWIQAVDLKTQFRKRSDFLKIDPRKIPANGHVQRVGQLLNGEFYLFGENLQDRWLTNGKSFAGLPYGTRSSILRTESGRLFFSRKTGFSDLAGERTEVLEMADDGTRISRKSFLTSSIHAASLFEQNGEVFAAFKTSARELRIESVTSQTPGRTLNVNVKDSATELNPDVLRVEGKNYLKIYYHDFEDRSVFEVHDPSRPGETRVFNSRWNTGLFVASARIWRDPPTGRLLLAIKGFQSLLIYDLEYSKLVLSLPTANDKQVSWRVSDDQVYMAMIGADKIFRVFRLYNETGRPK